MNKTTALTKPKSTGKPGRKPLKGTAEGDSQRMSFVISNELETKLRQYSRTYHITVSDLIRKGIEHVISS